MRGGLVALELALGVGDRKTVANHELVQAGGFTLDGADAEAPLLEGGIGAEIVAAHLLAADQLCQLIARGGAAGQGVGVLVDAHLVEGGRLDAVEAKGRAGELHIAAIPDGCARGMAPGRRQICENENEGRGEEGSPGPHMNSHQRQFMLRSF